MLDNFKVILWDFDGVLMNSNAVRNLGFEKVLAGYPAEQVAALMKFHKANGGLSRYVKFRYFFEQVLKEEVSDEKIQTLAASFSEIMLRLLVNPDLLIQDSLNFVESNYDKMPMHIVSGSDQKELRYLCNALKIDKYFKSILGSPIPKKQLVEGLIKKHKYSTTNTVLIGDSNNDYEAAEYNSIKFIGYNNPELEGDNFSYIGKFSQLNSIGEIFKTSKNI